MTFLKLNINTFLGLPTEAQRKEHEALELQARVEDWRNSIDPVLRKLDGQDFDIHDYGSRIMSRMALNESIQFNNIVEGNVF